MTINTKKRALFAAFLSVVTFVILASCGNDNSSVSKSAATSDSASASAADSSTMKTDTATAKMTKKRKGKASVMMSPDSTASKMSGKMKMQKDKDGVYSMAEQMPQYPGGQNALSDFISNNINYPQNAIDANAEGTIHVSFVVDENGKIMNPVVSGKSMGYGLDQEAVKVIKDMPAWKPGMVKGKAVKTRLFLPVTFKIADDAS